MNKFCVITCHFGDRFWIENLLFYLKRNNMISEIHIGHIFSDFELQTGITTGIDDLDTETIKVHKLVVDEKEDHPSLRHAKMLNSILAEVNNTVADRVLILDSDMIPLSQNWLIKVDEVLNTHDALIAISDKYSHNTHPCLVAFRNSLLSTLTIEAFAHFVLIDGKEGEFRIETASHLAHKLLSQGVNVALTRPFTKFGGKWFHCYLSGAITHIGNQSFQSRLRRKFPIKSYIYKVSTMLTYELPREIAIDIKKGRFTQKLPLRVLQLRFLFKRLPKLINLFLK